MRPFTNFAEMKKTLAKEDISVVSTFTIREIPEEKLEKLEEARIKLYDMAKRFNFNTWQIMELQEITEIMWEIANRKKF